MEAGPLFRRIGRLLRNPALLMVVVWSIVVLLAMLTPRETVVFYWGDDRVLGAKGALWLAACVGSFCLGAVAARSGRSGPNPSPVAQGDVSGWYRPSLAASLHVAAAVLVVVACVMGYRLLKAVQMSGGPAAAFTMMVTRQAYFKTQIWSATNIHGVGILENAAAGVVLYAVATWTRLAVLHEAGVAVPRRYRRLAARLAVVSGALLLVVCSLASERVLLFEGVGSACVVWVVVRCSASRRRNERDPVTIRGPRRSSRSNRLLVMLLAVGGLYLAWAVVELARSGKWGDWQVALLYPLQRLALYATINVRNVDSAVAYSASHTGGAMAFSFVLTAFGDEVSLASTGLLAYILSGLGTVPLPALAWVDFNGGGLLYLFVLGFVYQYAAIRAGSAKHPVWQELYSYGVAALLFSWVSFIPALSRFWLNVLVIVALHAAPSLLGVTSNSPPTEPRKPCASA